MKRHVQHGIDIAARRRSIGEDQRLEIRAERSKMLNDVRFRSVSRKDEQVGCARRYAACTVVRIGGLVTSKPASVSTAAIKPRITGLH